MKTGVTVIGIIHRYHNDVLQVLLQGSESIIPKYKAHGRLDKFPGGRVEESDVCFEDACAREVLEEVWLRLKDGVELEPVYDYVDRGERKIFYPIYIDDLEGEIRTVEVQDNSSRLFPPYWADLTPELLHSRLYWTHRPAGEEFYNKHKR